MVIAIEIKIEKMFLPNYKPYKPVEFYIYTIVAKNIYVLGKI